MIAISRPEGMSVEDQNAWFTTLTPDQQRVVLAQDVMVALDQARLIPTKGTYVYPTRCVQLTRNNLQQMLQNEICEVCGKGALLVARVGGYNHFELSYPRHKLGNSEVLDSLEGIFELETLNDVEAAFEGWATDQENPEEPGNWYRQLPINERMRAIMQNLIDHDGNFVMPEGVATC